MHLRPFTPDDYPAVARLDAQNFPDSPETAEQWRWSDEHRESHHKWARFVAEVDGETVGFGEYANESGMFHPRKFRLMILVAPETQGRGVGKALYAHLLYALEPLDPLSLRSFTREDMPRPLRFFGERGFVEDMRFWESELELSAFDFARFDGAEDSPAQHGLVVKTQAELMETDPNWKRNAYDLAQAISRDIPRPEPWTPTPFEAWEKRLGNPDKMPNATFIALDDTKWVGVSSLEKSPSEGRIGTGVTGVLPGYRRKGIALALKLRAARYAQEGGYAFIRTDNETRNRPMLAINEAMGFVKMPAWVTFVKILQPTPSV